MARRKLVELRVPVNLLSMSRRSQNRKSTRRSRAKLGGGKWKVRIVSFLLVFVMFGGFGVYAWLKSYLHSDKFRVFMGEIVGGAMGADAHFELFEWQGMDARTASFVAENGGVIRAVKADGVQARVGLGGIQRGVWEISGVRVGQLDLLIDTVPVLEVETDDDSLDDEPVASEEVKEPSFWAGLLPDRAEVDSVEVTSVDLKLNTAGGRLQAQHVGVRIDASSTSGVYDVELAGGVIDTDWFGSRIDLTSASGKWNNGRVFLTQSEGKVYDRGQLTLSGEVEGGDFSFVGSLTDVRAEELVPSDWKKRILGNVNTRFKVRSGSEHTVLRGKVDVQDAVLTALPVLDTIAAYTNTPRFRRLVLSEATFKFWKEGDRLDIRDIVIASEGLLRVVGSLSVRDRTLDGRFKVGIMPGTLSHIPGAETKVFLRSDDDGLLWAPLRITGTLDKPKEDLTERMIAAAGQRLFELVPETGKMALKFAHDSAVQLPSKATNAASKILDGDPEGALEEGTDIIEKGVDGIFGLIPGAPRSPQRKQDDEKDE